MKQSQERPHDSHSQAERRLREIKRDTEGRLADQKRREARWSWARLMTFFAAAGVWLPLQRIPALAAGLCGLLVVLFAACVIRHLRVRRRREFLERLLLVNEESLQRCRGQVQVIRGHERPSRETCGGNLKTALPDGAYWPLSAQEIDDLDLYAPPCGVYGLLNRASTMAGACHLSDMLEKPLLAATDIAARQDAVRWLDEHPQARLEILAAAAALRGQDRELDAFRSALHGASALPWSPGAIVAMRVWSLPSVIFALFAATRILSGQTQWITPLLVVVVVNSAIYLRIGATLTTAIEPWRALKRVSSRCLEALRRAADALPQDTLLAGLRQNFQSAITPRALPALTRRLGWADAGGAFHTLTNFLGFYDLHVAASILDRAVPGREALLQSLSAMAELEAIGSLACFAFEQPGACYAEFGAARGLRIREGRHPLIEPDEAVPNDLELSGHVRTWIITGSNMAGKSTFLRMVGVNTLLAQVAGLGVAREMSLCPVRLVTDLRVKDDLAKDESYFLAEVRHLRRMVLADADSAPLLGLIDEPFRGTNSRERVAASVALVRHLRDVCAADFFLIATHEQTLTELATGRPAANYHFREQMGASGAVFDYRLRAGPATIRNALRIMEREGYPATLVENARAWLENEEWE